MIWLAFGLGLTLGFTLSWMILLWLIFRNM